MIRVPTKSWYQTNTIWQIGLAAAGGTFVDWTINYLLDISERVVISEHHHQIYHVPDNPCKSEFGNAHKHTKNHPKDIGEIFWYSKFLHDIAASDIHVFYTYHHTQSLKDPIYLKNNFQSMSEFFVNIAPCPQIIVYGDFPCADLFLVYRHLMARNEVKCLDDVIRLDPETFEHMQDVCLPWIKRELIAIEFHRRRQQQKELLHQQQNLTQELAGLAWPIGIKQIFTEFDKLLPTMFSRFSGLKWHHDKVPQWLEIYHQWQTNNAQIQWFLHMPSWVENIIRGHKMLLPVLDELAQCCLEAELMRHNRSVCNHGLIQLPTCTAEFNTEPLIHDLS